MATDRDRRLDTHREILMIRALNAIPDKPNWDGKARRPCYEHARAGRLRCSMMRILPNGVRKFRTAGKTSASEC